MPATKKILLVKVAALIIFFGVFVVSAIPRYLNLNKQKEASQCRRNQMIVETALALAYAESLTVGNTNFPSRLTESMFDDGVIPTCPIDGSVIAFDSLTGSAYCPHHIESHERIY